MTKKTNVSGNDDPGWGLFYRESKKDMDARKSIKVKLPLRQHIKLHAMKLFTENNISETVERALDAYFKDMKAEEERMKDAEMGMVDGDLEIDVTGPGGAVGVVGATDVPSDTNE